VGFKSVLTYLDVENSSLIEAELSYITEKSIMRLLREITSWCITLLPSKIKVKLPMCLTKYHTMKMYPVLN